MGNPVPNGTVSLTIGEQSPPLKEVNVKWSGWGRGENVTSTIVAMRNEAKNGRKRFEIEMARGRGTRCVKGR